jgi:hypothetical protein
MDEFNPIVAAHKHSSNHRAELSESDICGCFYCLEVYSPKEIKDWIDDDKCALCAKCGIDSVIGSASNYPITKDFLKQMREYWFERTIPLSEVKKKLEDL